MKKKDRELVFNKYGGRCAYCGDELDSKWQVDHAVSKSYFFLIDPLNLKSVDKIENLMPACYPCNHYKRSLCVEPFDTHIGFRGYMSTFHNRLAKLPKSTNVHATKKRIEYMNVIAKKYGITPEKPFSGSFYFDKF